MHLTQRRSVQCRSGLSRNQARIACSATRHDISRRDLVGSLIATPLILSNAAANAEEVGASTYKNLSTFQKADEIADYFAFASKIISENVGPSDASAAIRLAILDAGTYDIASKSGGISGATVINPSSLEAGVEPLVEKLTKAKKAIDEVALRKGSKPISWADLIYLAGRSATLQNWRQIKKAKLGSIPYDNTFDNPWDTAIGRVESSTLGPNKAPPLTASVEEITSYLFQLGAKPGSGGFLSSKPPFWEQPAFLIWTASAPNPEEEEARWAASSPVYADIKKKYDSMRKGMVLGRANYEIDFARAYDKLTLLGAKLSPEQYCYPIQIVEVKF